MYNEKYVGEKKILGVIETELKTPGKGNIVEVLFDNGTKEVMPKLRLDTVVTETVSDASGVQAVFREKVSSTLYGFLHEYGAYWNEVEGILNAISGLTNDGYEKATNLLFGNPIEKVTLNNINDILLKNYEKENNNGGSPTGEGLTQ